MFGQIPTTPYDLRFTILGIPVRVHPVFWLTSLVLAWYPAEPGLTLVNVACIFVAILVHELGHAVVTRWFGWYPEIVLYFLGGYATTTRHSTWKNIAVSAAGPAAGFSLFGLTVVLRFTLDHNVLSNRLVAQAIGFSMFINLLWNAMNLIPALPLDGGQISRDFCCWLFHRHKGMAISLKVSIVSAGAVAVWSAYALSQNGSVLGLDPLFLGIMFGFLAFQSYQALEAWNQGYR